jgi:hypothetical protein
VTAGLPEITAVERLALQPGDTLVVHLNAYEIDMQQGAEIRDRIREITGRPDLQVMVLARDTSVEVISG